jgi:Protein of unknown function (DUF3662)/FHA domain
VSLAQRFERRLEAVVGSAFARVFKGQVEPVEIGNALQREATDKRAVMGNGLVYAPNRYRVTLGAADYERLAPWEVQLTNSLAELVQEHLDENNWTTVGDIEVYLHRDETLHTGVFGVASRMESEAPPRRRPYDSLSLPAVEGQSGEYAHPFDPGAPGPYPPVGGYAAAAAAGAPAFAAPAAPPPAQSAGPGPSYPPHAAPRPQVQAWLVVDGSNQHLALRQGSNLVGRGQDCDLQLMDQGVSRRHVDVQFDGQYAVAYDLGSTNGTSVNGHYVGSHQLQHGDVLRVGHSRLVFQQEVR